VTGRPVPLPQPDGLPPRWLCLVCRGLDGLHEPDCPVRPEPAPTAPTGNPK
jgi:hypothetical protein